jgi:protein SCO1/2
MKNAWICFVALCALLPLVFLGGCRSEDQGPSPQSSVKVTVYHLRGKVVSTDAQKGEVMLDHEAIPGFMEAMVMPYKLKDSNTISELHPGDKLTADVVVSDSPNADILLDHVVVVSQARADYRPVVVYHVPAAGDAVPDFKLTNQDGRQVHLAGYRLYWLLLFIRGVRCRSSVRA